MQVIRLYEILYMLLDKKIVTAKRIAERLEVSTRTIYRDINILSSAGIQIYMNKGKGGGISLQPDFDMNKEMLTDEEKESLLVSLKDVYPFNTHDDNANLDKLISIFGKSSSEWMEVDFSYFSNSQRDLELFDDIKNSIVTKKYIAFSYVNGKEQNASKVVEPIKLCFKSGSWYLYGYCRLRHEYQYFKLRRIKNHKILERHFVCKSPQMIINDQEVFEVDQIELKMKLAPQMACRVYEEFDNCEEQDDGSFIASIQYLNCETYINYAITFGEYGEIIEPVELRNDIVLKLKKILKNYMLN